MLPTNRYLPFILIFVLVTPMIFSAVFREIPVYNEWYLSDSNYRPSRPFFIINDLDFFINEWEKAGFKEDYPHIDFAKFSIFVWTPGATVKNYDQVRIEKIIHLQDGFIVLMDPSKAKSGRGFSRPVLFTLVPKIQKSDVFIYDIIYDNRGNIKDYDLKYTLWNMDGLRTTPMVVLKLDPPEKPTVALASMSREEKVKAGIIAAPSVSSQPTAVSAQTQSFSENRTKTPATQSIQVSAPTVRTSSYRPQTQMNTTTPNTVYSPGASTTTYSSRTSATSQVYSRPAGSQQNTRTSASVAKQKSPMTLEEMNTSQSNELIAPPGMTDDGLFGSKFDIEF
ncbi:MAG: hypothetical protein GX221_02460 [Candidatus Riflebacteria bacterium]|nr:hypothetical protein [Candidatus Riflebacteria bacterium]